METGADKKIRLGYPPVGVRLTRGEPPQAHGATGYQGTSFCEAVRHATAGTPVMLTPGSIEVCRWSPPVLGLKAPETDFEKEREPRMPEPVSAVIIARMDQWPPNIGDPDTVLVRASRDSFRALIALVGPDRVFHGPPAGMDRTMVPALSGARESRLKAALVRVVNQALDFLGRFDAWTGLTVWAFKREWTSRILNFLLDRAMANMSMCRNSTVIPLISGRLNVSHFCTGGISWGRNPPHLMTGGMPWAMYREVEESLDWT